MLRVRGLHRETFRLYTISVNVRPSAVVCIFRCACENSVYKQYANEIFRLTVSLLNEKILHTHTLICDFAQTAIACYEYVIDGVLLLC